MIVLDTNVVSELRRKASESARLPDSRRKRELFATVEGRSRKIFGTRFCRSMRRRRITTLKSWPPEKLPDARSRCGRADSSNLPHWNLGLATRNVDDFVDTGVDAVNPWNTATP